MQVKEGKHPANNKSTTETCLYPNFSFLRLTVSEILYFVLIETVLPVKISFFRILCKVSFITGLYVNKRLQHELVLRQKYFYKFGTGNTVGEISRNFEICLGNNKSYKLKFGEYVVDAFILHIILAGCFTL